MPLLHRPIAPQDMVPTRKVDTVTVVYESIPVPSENTDWAAILDWRSDTEAKTKFVRLQHWINEVSKSNRSAREFADMLETYIADYKSYMAIQHKKFGTGAIEALCIGVAEVLEGLPLIKLSPLLKAAFQAFPSKREMLLAEIESNARFREVAYLTATSSRFQTA